MDSYPSLIPIKHVFKVSGEKLKTELKSDKDEIISVVKAIKGTSDLECRIDLPLEIQHDEAGEEKKILAAYLTLLNIEEDTKIRFNFVFCIKLANSFKYEDGYYTHDNDSYGADVCTFADLFDPEKQFIVDGVFVIELKGIIFLKKEEIKTIKTGNVLTERLWKDEDERDFTIVVKENRRCKSEIKVHKCVLSVRSPVFNRMFKTDMKERQKGKVEIIHFDSYTVEDAVAFCYDQDIFGENLEWHQLINLQKFADKYDIADLKQQTELYLVEEISLENICAITNAVTNLNATKLQDFCFRFLMMSQKKGIPIKDIDNLDNGIAAELLKKSLSVEYC